MKTKTLFISLIVLLLASCGPTAKAQRSFSIIPLAGIMNKSFHNGIGNTLFTVEGIPSGIRYFGHNINEDFKLQKQLYDGKIFTAIIPCSENNGNNFDTKITTSPNIKDASKWVCRVKLLIFHDEGNYDRNSGLAPYDYYQYRDNHKNDKAIIYILKNNLNDIIYCSFNNLQGSQCISFVPEDQYSTQEKFEQDLIIKEKEIADSLSNLNLLAEIEKEKQVNDHIIKEKIQADSLINSKILLEQQKLDKIKKEKYELQVHKKKILDLNVDNKPFPIEILNHSMEYKGFYYFNFYMVNNDNVTFTTFNLDVYIKIKYKNGDKQEGYMMSYVGDGTYVLFGSADSHCIFNNFKSKDIINAGGKVDIGGDLNRTPISATLFIIIEKAISVDVELHKDTIERYNILSDWYEAQRKAGLR